MKKTSAYYEINGVFGMCGAREVFLGIAPASLLYAESFADTLDEDSGAGYQRIRNQAHSLDFKRYICKPDASTIPLTFNLRKELKRNWLIKRSKNGKAILRLSIGTKSLAQVDCQHRLGELRDSDISFAFMAFIGLDLRGEMAMFTVINSKARGLSSSLTDFHTSNLLDDLAIEAPHLFLARRLNEDVQSPWFKRIRCGGRSTSGLKRRTSLRMMQHSIRRVLIQSKCLDKMDIEEAANMLIKYWRAVATVFQTEWSNPRHYLITKGVGLYGLTQLLGSIVTANGCADCSENSFVQLLLPLKAHVDWGTGGSFSTAGGHKGANKVHMVLKGLLSL